MGKGQSGRRESRNGNVGVEPSVPFGRWSGFIGIDLARVIEKYDTCSQVSFPMISGRISLITLGVNSGLMWPFRLMTMLTVMSPKTDIDQEFREETSELPRFVRPLLQQSLIRSTYVGSYIHRSNYLLRNHNVTCRRPTVPVLGSSAKRPRAWCLAEHLVYTSTFS